MAALKTSLLSARIEPTKHAKFLRLAKNRGLTETQLLRLMIDTVIEEEAIPVTQVKPDKEKTHIERMTIRLPAFLKEAVSARAKEKNMQSSRWVSSLVQSNLMKIPVVTDSEMAALQENSRELAAIGRNLNQIAKALNESFHETDRVKYEKLVELNLLIKRNREAINTVVRASNNVWSGN